MTDLKIEKEKAPMVINLPSILIERIGTEKSALATQIQRLREQSDRLLTTLLEGFLAANPDANGKNFELSEDNSKLIEKK